jgi:excisionase family DNA binding protein
MKVELQDLITQTEAAEIRGVSNQAISDLVKRGKLRTLSIGKRKFLLRSEVKAYKPAKGGRPRTRKPKRRPKQK